MKFLSLITYSIAISFLSIATSAQGPKELKTASSRPWQTIAIPSETSLTGMSISLPNFFKHRNLMNGAVRFEPRNRRNYGIVIFVTPLGKDWALKNRYESLVNSSIEDNKVTSKSLSENSYTIWSDLHGKLDSDGKEQELGLYAHGLLMPDGAYEVYVRFQPEYRDAITAILPRIVASLKPAI